MQSKPCTKCGEVKTLDLFFARKGATDGRMSLCKACKTAAIYKWREKNKDRWNAYCSDRGKLPHVAEKKKAYTQLDHVKARGRERDAKRRLDPEFKRKRSEYEKSEKVKTYRKEYKAKPDRQKRTRDLSKREHQMEYHRNHQRKKRQSDPGYRLHSAISCSVRSGIVKGGKSWPSILGFSLQELMQHLEKQFTKGMTWENYGEWHVDHIIPRAAFKFETAEDPDFKACWSISNLRPIWGRENLSKSDKALFLL
jgi:hypothetical protein